PEFSSLTGWLSFGPDARTFLRESYGPLYRTEQRLALWDFEGICVRTFGWTERFGPRHAAFSPDGRVLFVGCHGTVTLWDAASGRLLGKMEDVGGVELLALSPNGHSLATAAGRVVKLWDVESRQCRHTARAFRATVEALTFSPDGRLLAAGAREGRVRMWDVA